MWLIIDCIFELPAILFGSLNYNKSRVLSSIYIVVDGFCIARSIILLLYSLRRSCNPKDK